MYVLYLLYECTAIERIPFMLRSTCIVYSTKYIMPVAVITTLHPSNTLKKSSSAPLNVLTTTLNASNTPSNALKTSSNASTITLECFENIN